MDPKVVLGAVGEVVAGSPLVELPGRGASDVVEGVVADGGVERRSFVVEGFGAGAAVDAGLRYPPTGEPLLLGRLSNAFEKS